MSEIVEEAKRQGIVISGFKFESIKLLVYGEKKERTIVSYINLENCWVKQT